MKRRIFLSIGAVIAGLLLVSWGSTGHQKINGSSSLSFNAAMTQFQAWSATLAAHASDADIRKATDPTEGPKHYIDVDNYSDFLNNGFIIQDFDSAISAYGQTAIYDNGILPWATIICYDSLRSCFEREDWSQAVLFAADLGHYVADGHMPLHITRNYNGQYTGNTGIHSRYESTMINAYIGQMVYGGDSIQQVPDVSQYIFDYLYQNYIYVDSVIAADNYAISLSSNTSSSTYKQALWDASSGFTIQLFRDASHALAELMYSAWLEAGSPLINPSAIENFEASFPGYRLRSYPNPANGDARIDFTLPASTQVELEVYDVRGSLLYTLLDESLHGGQHSASLDCQAMPSGFYFIVLKANGRSEVKKIVVQ